MHPRTLRKIMSQLSPEQKSLFFSTMKTRRNIISARSSLGVEDVPLLLLYCVDKNRGKDTKSGTKTKLNSSFDIIGFSVIVSGESSGEGHAKAVTVRLS